MLKKIITVLNLNTKAFLLSCYTSAWIRMFMLTYYYNLTYAEVKILSNSRSQTESVCLKRQDYSYYES